MKKQRQMSKKRSKHIILNSRKELVVKKIRTGINPINKDEVKLDASIKAEAKVKLMRVKAMRKLRDTKQLEAHKAEMTARAERRTETAKVEAEAKLKAREETKLRKELKAIAKADAKKLYLEKKAMKNGKINSRVKRRNLVREVDESIKEAA